MKKAKALPVAVLLLLPVLSHAQNPGWDLRSTDEWRYSLAPLFLWGMSISGEATAKDQTLPLELDFRDDVLKNMTGVFTLHFEATRGDWGVFAEYQFANLEPEFRVEAPGPIPGLGGKIDFKNTMAEVGGLYAFHDSEAYRWEAIYGVRWTRQDIDVDIQPGIPLPPPVPTAFNTGDSWLDAFLGVRMQVKLGHKWLFTARGDVGAGGSDLVYNGAAQFHFRMAKWGSLFGGYRYLKYDYSSKDYGYKAAQQGPLLGLNIHW